jgi:hypothetical protein
MNLGADPKEEARRCRDLARRARRMAANLAQPADRARVNRYADELEGRAAELEQKAAGPPAVMVIAPHPVTQQQQQVQQRQTPQSSINPDKPKP